MNVEEFEKNYNEMKVAKRIKAQIVNAKNKIKHLSPDVLPNEKSIDDLLDSLLHEISRIRGKINAKFPTRSEGGTDLFHEMVEKNDWELKHLKGHRRDG